MENVLDPGQQYLSACRLLPPARSSTAYTNETYPKIFDNKVLLATVTGSRGDVGGFKLIVLDWTIVKTGTARPTID